MFCTSLSSAVNGEEAPDRGFLFNAYLAAAQHAMYGQDYAEDAQITQDAASAALPGAAKNELLEELSGLPAGLSVTCEFLPIGERHRFWLSTFILEHPHLAALSASEAEIYSALESITYARAALGAAATQSNMLSLRELVKKKWGLSAKQLTPELLSSIETATKWLARSIDAKVCLLSYTKYDMSGEATAQLDDPVLELVFQIAKFANGERAHEATAFAEAAQPDGLDMEFTMDLRRSGILKYDFWRDWPLNSRTHIVDNVWLQPREFKLQGCIKPDVNSCQLTFVGVVHRPIDLSPLKSIAQGM